MKEAANRGKGKTLLISAGIEIMLIIGKVTLSKIGNMVEFFLSLWYIMIKESTCGNRCFSGKLPIDG